MSRSSIVPGPRVTAVLLVLAPLGMVAEGFLSPIDATSTADDLRSIAAHQGAFQLATLVGTVATFLFVPAFLGLAQACATRSPRLARAGGWLCAAGMGGFLGIRMGQAVELAGVRQDVDRQALAGTVDHATANWIGAPILVVFFVGVFVGLLLLAVAGWRAGLPRAACVFLAVFQVVDFVAPDRPVPWSHLVLLTALGWIGWQLWGTSAETVVVARPEEALAG